MRRTDRLLAVAAALLIAVYFFFLVRPGFQVYFSPDDAVNLYKPWILPARDLIKASFVLFLSSPLRNHFNEWYPFQQMCLLICNLGFLP
jgi:hypothetical protein